MPLHKQLFMTSHRLFLGFIRFCFVVAFPVFFAPFANAQTDTPSASTSTSVTPPTEKRAPTANHALTKLDPRLNSVDSLLRQSFIALKSANYVGSFTYEFGGAMETLEISHHVKDGLEYEVVKHLNGSRRIFAGDGRPVDCVSLGSFLFSGGMLATREGSLSLSDSYHFAVVGEDRIADRPAVVVDVIPRDRYRYGLSLAFDKASRLPLRMLTIDVKKTAIERFQFVSLTVFDKLPQGKIDSMASDTEGPHSVIDAPNCKKAVEQEGVQTAGADKKAENKKPIKQLAWRPSWLPTGFILSQSSADETYEEITTYSDGIASFTVFIAKDGMTKASSGLARRGATVALMSDLTGPNGEKYDVSLVGEIPVLTAQTVVSSLTPVQNIARHLID